MIISVCIRKHKPYFYVEFADYEMYKYICGHDMMAMLPLWRCPNLHSISKYQANH